MVNTLNAGQQFSTLTLAYVGDGVYELYIRTRLLENGDMKVNKLHKIAKNYVSAKAQCAIVTRLLEELSEDEISIFKRGRNTKVNTKAKNADLHEYHTATGLEALVGYLYLSKKEERLNVILKRCFEIAEILNKERADKV